MTHRFALMPPAFRAATDPALWETLGWIAAHCRSVAREHMALAEKAEELTENFLENRRFRTGLRTFARHHRRAAWQHLQMAQRADDARRRGTEEFDLADVVSA